MSRTLRQIPVIIAIAAGALVASSPARADNAYYWYCHNISSDNTKVYYSDVFRSDRSESTIGADFYEFMRSRYSERPGACFNFDSLSEAEKHRAYASNNARNGRDVVETHWTLGMGSAVKSAANTEAASAVSSPVVETVRPRKTKAEADAEFAQKTAEFDRQMEEYRRAVAEADRKKAEYEKSLADAKRRATEEYKEWERRKAACEGGDHTQCAALVSRQ